MHEHVCCQMSEVACILECSHHTPLAGSKDPDLGDPQATAEFRHQVDLTIVLMADGLLPPHPWQAAEAAHTSHEAPSGPLADLLHVV